MKKYFILLSVIYLILMCGCENNKSDNNVSVANSIENETSDDDNFITESEIQTEPITSRTIDNDKSDYEICPKLDEILNTGQYDIENAQQLITVVSAGCQCEVSAFELSDDLWSERHSASGIVGKDGVSENSSENNCHTPKGVFDIGFAFGTEPFENPAIEYRQINENCYWIDDPQSELYNQWVESGDITWNSAEHLIEYPESYKYAVSINYNMNPVIPYAGSAIFLHCDDGNYDYTAGCIAVPESDMINILNWLDKNKNSIIIII